MTTYKTLDLFSGCGGLTLGLSWAGEGTDSRFKCVAAMDNWKPAAEAFALNLGLVPDADYIKRDTLDRVLSRIGEVDIVVGGPPCQGFSTSGKRALDDPRNSLVVAFLEAVEMAKPRAFIMENVMGFTHFQGGAVFSEVVAVARGLGYNVFPGLVLASLHGVPQRRRRFIMAGVKDGEFAFPGSKKPPVEHGFFDDLLPTVLVVDQTPADGKELWTFDDATSDLAEIPAGGSGVDYASKPKNDYQRWVRGKEKHITDHTAVNHRPAFIEMMKYIPQGKSAMDAAVREHMPEHLRPSSGFPNSYARIRGDQPSPTITRNFTTPSSANCIHPRQHRALSLREGARCQSFPDSFKFVGSIDDKRLMIGNAVPPLLGKALGNALLSALEGSAAEA